MTLHAALFMTGFLLLAVGLGSAYAPQSATLSAGSGTAPSDAQKVAALLAKLPQPAALDAVKKTSNCRVSGPYPDHACTPGAVFASATLAQICTPGYSEGARNVSTKLKQQIYSAYGISYPQKTGTYELDHLVPLELGGSNAPANLFPEVEPADGGAADPATASGGAPQNAVGFKEKDVVEDYLHEEVCAGALNLEAAQTQIADDWLAVYDSLSPATISAIKQKFASWAD